MDASTSPSFDAKPKMIDGKIIWAGGPSCKQRFSLPYSIIYYMAMNPSTAEVYNKLIQSCKYFFEKNPILVAADLFGKTKICSNEECSGDNEENCCIEIDMAKLSSKLWLTNIISLRDENISIFASLIVPTLYRCKSVKFYFIQNGFLYNDFKSYAALLTNIDFFKTQVINDDDGSVVMLEKILEEVPNVKIFEYCFTNDFSMINASTMRKINALKNLQHLKSFTLRSLPELFNIEDISTFIKDHPATKIYLSFNNQISVEYKTQLDAVIDTVIEAAIPKHLIYYTGQNKEKYIIMNRCYYK